MKSGTKLILGMLLPVGVGLLLLVAFKLGVGRRRKWNRGEEVRRIRQEWASHSGEGGA